MNKHSGDLESYIIISRFIKIHQTLPASESAAERIFARMHDIINEKQDYQKNHYDLKLF